MKIDLNCFAYRFRSFFYCKTLLWTKKIRIYCDGGYPPITYYPKFRFHIYDKYWQMYGFVITFLGREFYFSFGEDVKGLYKGRKK